MRTKRKHFTQWDRNYLNGRYNEYPYDLIVSMVARYYYRCRSRREIRALDLGYGGGNHIVFLAEQGFDTYGVDSSSVAKDITAQRLKEKGFSAHLFEDDLTALPFPARHFDCIIDRASLQHNDIRSIRKIIDEIRRTLKKGGRFIGVLVDRRHPARRFGTKMALEQTYTDFSKGAFMDSGLTHFFSAGELTRLFTGFTIESMIRHAVFDETKSGKKLVLSEFLLVART